MHSGRKRGPRADGGDGRKCNQIRPIWQVFMSDVHLRNLSRALVLKPQPAMAQAPGSGHFLAVKAGRGGGADVGRTPRGSGTGSWLGCGQVTEAPTQVPVGTPPPPPQTPRPPFTPPFHPTHSPPPMTVRERGDTTRRNAAQPQPGCSPQGGRLFRGAKGTGRKGGHGHINPAPSRCHWNCPPIIPQGHTKTVCVACALSPRSSCLTFTLWSLSLWRPSDVGGL